MNQTNNTLTREEMTEALYLRAEEIFLLCATITRRGIAHAFYELSSHVQVVSSRVAAVDTNYSASERGPDLAMLRVDLKLSTPEECIYPEEINAEYDQAMQDMNAYIDHLDQLIERGQPVKNNPEEVAA